MASSDRAYLFALGEAGPPRQLGLGAIWRRAQKSGNILVELSEEEVRQHSTTGHLEIRADANRHWPRRGDDIDDVEMPLLKEVEPTPGEKAGLKHDLTARAAASEAAAASLLAELETQEQEKKKKKKKKKTAKPKTELLAEEPPQGTPGRCHDPKSDSRFALFERRLTALLDVLRRSVAGGTRSGGTKCYRPSDGMDPDVWRLR
ncbi:hypothetical protein BC832DRAFT_551040 [Gaertneriomyces semiglobifer]|nr:hypothetical protein BC832DRAFT_551040 [Gaertneriomyces semiglobifer]